MVFIVVCLSLTYCKIDARSNTLLEGENHFTRSNNLRKIQHQVDRDFYCVDIYEQPALQHPLLKNHKIQLYPTFAKNVIQSSLSYSKIMDGNADKCLAGKVPIYKRRKVHQIITNLSSRLQTDDFQQYSRSSPGYHTVTLDTTQNMIFHGASVEIGMYNLSLQADQYSMSSMWLEGGSSMEFNSIQIGVGVHPSLYGDSKLRLTGHWTAYKKMGCYNDNCPGFVQVNQDKDYALGSVMYPTSLIGSQSKWTAPIKIKQDRTTGHWWLIIQKEPIYVGYWPKELFSHLSKGASLIKFGGQTYAPPNKDSPPMGSGRLPKEKFKNSGFMGLLKVIDSEYNENDINPKYMKQYSDTKPDCYDLWYHGYEGSEYKQSFLYGGPGGRNCDI
ncbi:protein neprosin-like [Vicia villosa]|uniref:protein neprosin-like n=1 Tax=Vicia villosa TaxID=3911 RepID=UPI00273C19B4|nr:protein neprosin-like [Vicia villosa]